MSAIEVQQLNVYPIKSCGGVEVDEAAIGSRGFEHDRDYMLVDEYGVFVSQRTNAEMALIQVALAHDGLSVQAPSQERIFLPFENEAAEATVEVDMFNKPGSGIDQGRAVNEYFSGFLQRQVRLIKIKDERHLKPECLVDGAVVTTGFADGFPILLTSNASLDQLNSGLDEVVDISRFRSNIVVAGAELAPYEEDYWRQLQIGSLQAYVVRACARCPIPNIDQSVGVLPKQRSVSQELRRVRRGIDPITDKRGEFFGQNLIHTYVPGQAVRVGDKVDVITSADERNFKQLTFA